MRSFDQLTDVGRARRLGTLAKQCLAEHYDLPNVRVRLLAAHSFNTTFRVDTEAGPSVLRVGDEIRIHSPAVEAVEACWLDSLSNAGLTGLRNIAAPDGSRSATALHPAVPGPRACTRFAWVPGRQLRRQFDRGAAKRAGQLLARLHDHAAAFSPSTEISNELHATSAIYFGSEDLVAGPRSVHGSLFADATARVQQFVDRLWRSGNTPHLLHGDFGAHNILTARGHMQPIDFQDLRFGFPIQDLGITLADMKRTTPEHTESFLAGYDSVRPLPELVADDLAILGAARSLNIMNLALLSPASSFGQAFDAHAERIIAWMGTA